MTGHTIESWEYFGHLVHYSLLCGHFTVSLSPEKERPYKEIVAKIVDPLLSSTSKLSVYAPSLQNRALDHLVAHATKRRGKLELEQPCEGSLTDVIEANASGTAVCGSIVFELREDCLPTILSETWDPRVISNVSSACTPSAIRYCRNRSKNRGQTLALLSEANGGTDWLVIFEGEKKMRETVRKAARYCNASPYLKRCYGPGVKLAPLEDHVSFGGFAE